MIGIMGDVCLMLALSMALVQTLSVGLSRRTPRSLRLVQPASLAQCLFILAAFFLLMAGYAVSDFSLLNVVLNSHSAKPFIYKLSATWGNHEGSMLLWMLVLSGFGWLAGRGNTSRALRDGMLCAQGLLAAGLLLFILISSNPFVVIDPAPADGQGLNPLLQDIGLALHPPMLYLGYVGFGIVFAFALAGMWQQRIDRDWARTIHPWIALSWGCLSIGIGLGSWWAYRELGWGGWWFWDPVENVSLLPWLAGLALLHANRVLMVRDQFAQWTLLLAILCFTLSLIGTFIVRSGLLISVHSFASDPARGLFILAYVVLIVGAALALYARFQPPARETLSLWSRQGFILLNSLLLLAATATILLAILYPIMLQLFNQPSITVGPPYFNQTVLPLLAPLILLAAVAPFLLWQGRARIRHALIPMAGISAVIGILTFALLDHNTLLSAAGIALAAWLAVGTLLWFLRQRRQAGGVRPHHWAMIIAHGGAAVFVAALTLSALQKSTYEQAMRAGERAQLGEYELVFMQERLREGSNYVSRSAQVRLFHDGDEIATLEPEIRHYPIRNMQTAEAAIASTAFRDIYISAGLQTEPELLGFTLHINPAISWLWLGFLLMGAGGLVSAYTYRRSRDG